MYMRNSSGVVFPLNPTLLADVGLGFTACDIQGRDLPAATVVPAAPVEVAPAAAKTIKSTRGRKLAESADDAS